jgi:hypothetical protein
MEELMGDNIKMDAEDGSRTKMAQNSVHWRIFVLALLNLRVLLQQQKFILHSLDAKCMDVKMIVMETEKERLCSVMLFGFM